MLTVKRLAGVAPEVYLMECIIHTPLSNADKTTDADLEAQMTLSPIQNRGVSGPLKGSVTTENTLKNINFIG